MGKKISHLLVGLYWLEELAVENTARKSLLLRGCDGRALRRSFQLLLARKLIVSGKGDCRLAQKARKMVELNFPLWTKRKETWDKRWSLLVFDLPVKTKGLRHSFRNLLARLGFGRIQRSTFISPYEWTPELKVWLAARGIKINHPDANSIFLFRTKKDFNFNLSLCWPMKKLEEQYRQSMNKKSVYQQFNLLLETLLLDPWLPVENISVNFIRKRAIFDFLNRAKAHFGEK